MCTRVGTRPCPVCRSLGWRPPQRGKQRPRPPTHGQLPSLLLKPKNLKKSGPGFIGSRVERAGPKRTRRSAAVTIRRPHASAPILGSFSHILRQAHQETCHSPFKDGPGRRHARRSPLRPGHRGLGPAGPSLQTPTLPRLSPQRSGRKDAPGCGPRRPPLLLRLRGTASSFVPPGPGGPGPRPLQPPFLSPAAIRRLRSRAGLGRMRAPPSFSLHFFSQ